MWEWNPGWNETERLREKERERDGTIPKKNLFQEHTEERDEHWILKTKKTHNDQANEVHHRNGIWKPKIATV